MSYKISNEIKQQTIEIMQSELNKQQTLKPKVNLSSNRLLIASLSIVLVSTIAINSATNSSNNLSINDTLFYSENNNSNITPIPMTEQDINSKIYSTLKEMIICKPLDDWNSNYISQGYKKDTHQAYDILKSLDSPIYAFSSGVVTTSEWLGSFGNLVVIDHGNGISTYYGHCNQLLVQVGDTINAGDTIATVGTTGNSANMNLHFETRYNDEAFDIYEFLDPGTFYISNMYFEDEYQIYMTKIAEYDPTYTENTPFEWYDSKSLSQLSTQDIDSIRMSHAKQYYELILESEIPPISQTQHDELQSKFDMMTLSNPLDYWERISTPYTQVPYEFWGSPRIHRAYDIPNDKGNPIYSIADGVVVSSEYQATEQGKVIIIDHGDNLLSYYAHCNEIIVNVGDTVKSGQTIATVGTTGASTGPHLHFEVSYQNIPFDICTFEFDDKSLFNFERQVYY